MPLGCLWHNWPKDNQKELIRKLIQLETRLRSMKFKRHGCIYYKKDISRKCVRTYDLEDGLDISTSQSSHVDPSFLRKFAFGPLTDANIWRDERKYLDLDRGPCKFRLLA